MRVTSPSHRTVGPSLIELIVVIVILGVLAALAIPTFAGVIHRSQDETTITTLEAVTCDAQALAALEARTVTMAEVETATLELGSFSATGTVAAAWSACRPPMTTPATSTTPSWPGTCT